MSKKHPVIKHVSAAEIEKVQRYASYLLLEFGVGENFQIIIMDETAEKWNDDSEPGSTLAGIEIHEQKFSASLYLGSGWDGLTTAQKVSSLAHEMIHILHKRVDQVVYDHLDIDWLPDRLSEAGKALYMREMEMVVDRLTRVILPCLADWDRTNEMPMRNVVIVGDHI